MSDWTVVTAVFGGWDRLLPVKHHQSARCVCFTDEPFECRGWDVIAIPPPSSSPRMSARRVKLLTHEYIGGNTIWVDAVMMLKGDMAELAEQCGDFAIPKHTHRNCVYTELLAIASSGKVLFQTCATIAARYQAEGMPAHFGLWETGIVVRRDKPQVQRFCVEWWNELCQTSTRDQPALAYTAFEQGWGPEFIELSVWKNQYAQVRQHKGRILHHGAPRTDGVRQVHSG